MRGLLATLEFRFSVVPAHLFGLCYDHVFAFDYLGWIGMLYWETFQYLPCFVITLGMPYLPLAGPLGWEIFIIGMASFLVWLTYIGLLVWGTVRLNMPLLDHSWYVYIAPNTGMLHNTCNHACSKTVHALQTRVVTIGGKQCWFLDI